MNIFPKKFERAAVSPLPLTTKTKITCKFSSKIALFLTTYTQLTPKFFKKFSHFFKIFSKNITPILHCKFCVSVHVNRFYFFYVFCHIKFFWDLLTQNLQCKFGVSVHVNGFFLFKPSKNAWDPLTENLQCELDVMVHINFIYVFLQNGAGWLLTPYTNIACNIYLKLAFLFTTYSRLTRNFT